MTRSPVRKSLWRRSSLWLGLSCGLFSRGAGADPATLLQQGKFREAQAAYEALAEQNPQDTRLRYNAGVAAFRSGDTTTAQKYFEAATSATDLDLQQRAWYNLGNAWFQQASAPETEDREATLKKAEEAFSAAAQLTPQDTAATDNLAAVKKLAEELRKQQEQSQDPQSQDGQKDPKKDKGQKGQKGQKGKNGKSGKGDQDNSQSEKSDDAKSDPAKPDGEKPPAPDPAGKSPQSKPGEEKKSDGKSDDSASAGKDKKKSEEAQRNQANRSTNSPANGSKTNQTAQAGDKAKDKTGDQSGIQRGEGSDAAGAEGQAAQAATDGERMTVMQAQQMLDAQKGSEKPIWTLIRGWGQENQPTPNTSVRRKSW